MAVPCAVEPARITPSPSTMHCLAREIASRGKRSSFHWVTKSTTAAVAWVSLGVGMLGIGILGVGSLKFRFARQGYIARRARRKRAKIEGHSMGALPLIGLMLGDATGIGPEIAVKVLS